MGRAIVGQSIQVAVKVRVVIGVVDCHWGIHSFCLSFVPKRRRLRIVVDLGATLRARRVGRRLGSNRNASDAERAKGALQELPQADDDWRAIPPLGFHDEDESVLHRFTPAASCRPNRENQ